MRRKLFIIFLLLFGQLLHLDSGAETSFVLNSINGRLKGSVLDLNGDSIAFAAIQFNGDKSSKEVVADKHGEYEIELPAGKYRVKSVVRGFAPFRRASFRVQPGKSKILNLVLPVGGVLATIPPSDAYKQGNGPLQYEEVLPAHSSEAEHEILVRFRLRTEQNGIVEYRAGSIDPRVMVSYDLLAIYAEKVRVDKKNGTLEAEGALVIEDGEQSRRAAYTKLEFKDGKVQLTTTKTSSR